MVGGGLKSVFSDCLLHFCQLPGHLYPKPEKIVNS